MLSAARCALLIPLIAVLALSGCRTRGSSSVEADELRTENQRLAGQVDSLSKKNSSLQAELQNAREELAKKKDGGTVGKQMQRILDGEGIEGTTKTDTGGLALSEDFAFAKGSAELSPEGKRSLDQIAARLNSAEYAGTKVGVEGHTDDTPVARASTKEKYVDNWGLSGARAAAVVRALQAAGVDAKRIHGKFRGEYQPRGGDKASNRRVEISIE
jgi:chemotaxis protein MotB